MLLHRYDPNTYEYINTFEAKVDSRASIDGKTVYFQYPCTTTVVPPKTNQMYRVVVFDIKTKSWFITPDYRGVTVYNKESKEAIVWNEIGALPEIVTLREPDETLIQFLEWNNITSSWEIGESGRAQLLDEIWKIRKAKREAMCATDIEYDGHMIHVDATSFNDIMLAAQEAIVSGDMETTKRWVTADNIDVQLCGNDFVAIARAYGLRRQQLVYESNEAWQQDTMRTTEELENLYYQLIHPEDVSSEDKSEESVDVEEQE